MAGLKGKALQKGLDIIMQLSSTGRDMSVSEIAGNLDLSRGYTYELLECLVEKGFVEKDNKSKQYCLSPIFIALGNVAFMQMKLPVIVAPVLQDLVKKTDCNASVAIPMMNKAVTIARVESAKSLHVNINVGQSIPLHAGAISKVLLSNMDADFIQSVIDTAGIEDKDNFKKDLEAIRKQGFAISRQERISRFMALAVPVYDNSEEVIASLSIAAPIVDMERKNVDELIHQLQYSSSLISEALHANAVY